MKRLLLAVCAAAFLNSCLVVKEYEKAYLNDSEMELTDKKCNRHVLVAQSYREGAVGANGGKTGGGCGCN
ncbi:DUF4266 domain-containing protein [Maribacter sp. 2-571]|uniref:DUF4266 domain-containing protein n=1 Tax=Maribacter sp. 2-571 TaxID=3417569 RepID=UPI003D331AC8